jgi:CheY-like chemotaxis protein
LREKTHKNYFLRQTRALGKKAGTEDEMAKILILSEQPSAREFIAEELAGEGHLVVAIGSPALIGEPLTTLESDLVLLDFLKRRMDLGGGAGGDQKARPPSPSLYLHLLWPL